MKYLLCRPRGGFNDLLTQVELCWRYADLHNRILVIDTEYLVTTGISVRFSKLFETQKIHKNVFLSLSSTLLDKLNDLSTFPPTCAKRLNNYEVKPGATGRVDKKNGVPLTFNFNKHYSEDLLVHDQFGGGRLAINCLSRLKFTKQFNEDLLKQLSPLIGKNHIAIHIRHTDYQTNYIDVFKKIYPHSINQRLLLCTDSVEVLKYASVYFDQSDLISLSLPPDTRGLGLPTYATFHCNHEQRYELVIQSFSDLIGLATAKKTFFCKLTPGKFSLTASKHQDFTVYATRIYKTSTKNIGVNGFSGFSFLADSLKKNPTIMNNFFSNPNWYEDTIIGF